MPTTCKILFDNPTGVYYSGQTLSGRIILVTDKPKSIRCIKVDVIGKGYVTWTESRSHTDNEGHSHHETVRRHREVNYINSRKVVLGDLHGSSFDLPPGNHEYAFSTFLTPECRTSFIGDHGHRKYSITVTLDKPFQLDNVFKQPFTVIQPYDLNMDSSLATPELCEDESLNGNCCCNSGSVKTTVFVPFQGYVPGQKVPVTITIQNESESDLSDVRIKFVQSIIYDCTSSHNEYETNTLHTKHFGDVIKLTNKQFTDEIQVPSIPPSCQTLSDLINISYGLNIKYTTGFCSSDGSIHANLKIGTVPILASATNPLPDNVIVYQPSAPLLPGGDGDNPPEYVPSVPPSYEDAILTDNHKNFKEHEDGDDDKHQSEPHIPKYPVYYNFAERPTEGANGPSSSSNYGWNMSIQK